MVSPVGDQPWVPVAKKKEEKKKTEKKLTLPIAKFIRKWVTGPKEFSIDFGYKL